MTRYVLPDLPYDYGALEPHLSARIMELHHDKHHKAYVEGANRAIEQLLEARAKEDFHAIDAIEHALAFNVSGHVLHSIFWQNLSPDGGDRPTGELARMIDRDFEAFGRFKQQRRSVGASSEREDDLCAQASEPPVMKLVQRAPFRSRQQLLRSLRRSGLELRLCGGQRGCDQKAEDQRFHNTPLESTDQQSAITNRQFGIENLQSALSILLSANVLLEIGDW